MPQLDSVIFFLESLSLIICFFSLVFYNQYIFYPRLLKSLFVRRFLILNMNETINLFLKNFLILVRYLKNFDLFFFKINLKSLVHIILINSLNLFKKINFIFKIKFIFLNKNLNLFFNKLAWIFMIHRDFILNYDLKI
jgi:hypothetical protein